MHSRFLMKPFLMMATNEDGSNAEGGGTENPPQGQAQDPIGEGAGDTDDFGYAKTPSKDPEKKPITEDKSGDEPKFKSGYDDIKDAPAPEPEKKPEGEASKLNFEGLADTEVTKLSERVKAYGLSDEIAQKLVDDRKADLAASEQARKDEEAAVKKRTEDTKRVWARELRDDKVFGGKNFDVNIKSVERVVEDFMPNTKKILTERGSVLPPSTMKDLLNLANRLYGTEGKPSGDPTVTEVEKNDPDAELREMYGL